MHIFDDINNPEIVGLLKQGAVGVLPTDTVYGLACLASHERAVARLYSLKSRDNKPGTVIASSIDQLVELGIPRRYLTAVEHFWPNPISIVVASTPDMAYLDQGKMSLAMRIPSEPLINVFLKSTGPLLTSSANLPGKPPANTIYEAKAFFGDRVDFYVDGGDLSSREPSTIIRIIDDAVEVIRVGAVKINEKGQVT